MIVARLVLRRLALGAVTLVLVSILVFWATQVLPGNAATAILGGSQTPARIAALERQLHLDESAPAQYWHWFSGILHGDLGISLSTQQPVSELVSGRLANSAFLVLMAALLAIPSAMAIGVVTAMRRDRLLDHATSTGMLVLAALPEFVIGLILILLFATGLFQWLPPVSNLAPGVPAWEFPDQLVLPVATLAIAVMPYVSRMMRNSMIEVLEADYVEMARLKGLTRRVVLLRHALPNALAPVLQVSALQLAWMAGGVVLVEYLFNFPGVGSALVNAVANRDIPVVQALTVIIGGFYVLVNLVADVLVVLLTPKLRTAAR